MGPQVGWRIVLDLSCFCLDCASGIEEARRLWGAAPEDELVKVSELRQPLARQRRLSCDNCGKAF